MRRIVIVCTLAATSAAAIAAPSTMTTADPVPAPGQAPTLRNGCTSLYSQTAARSYFRRVYKRRRIGKQARANMRRFELCQQDWRAQRSTRIYRTSLEARWWATCRTNRLRVNGKASVFEGPEFGIAMRFSRGMYWRLVSPNRVVTVQLQTDWGPASWTGREFDLTGVAAAQHRYSYDGFPTDVGVWHAQYLGRRLPKGVSLGRQSPTC